MLLTLKKKPLYKKHKFVPAFGTFTPFDATLVPNTIALYDGDTLALDPINTWSDSSGNGNTLTLVNGPTLQVAAINGHDALRFDGINQYAQSLTPVCLQPYIIYVVLKQITWVNGAVMIDDGITNNISYFRNLVGTPQVRWSGSGNEVFSSQLIVNTYNICTLLGNGNNSALRIGLNSAIVTTPGWGTNTRNGITIAAKE